MTRFSADALARTTTLRQLQILVAVARHGGYTRAAEALHLTQPTASMQVKKRRSRIGLPLFEKRGKKPHILDIKEFLLRHHWFAVLDE